MSSLLRKFRFRGNMLPYRHNYYINNSIINNYKCNGYNNINRILMRNFGIKVYKCPEPGEGTVEVDILEWLVKPGDKVKSLDVIGKAKYEKADIDIVSPFTGVINKLCVDAGTICRVGEPLVEFDVEGKSDDIKSSTAKTTLSVNNDINGSNANINNNKSNEAMEVNGKVLTIPAVRALASEYGIDLTLVTPTGKNGRILKEDVLNFMNSGGNNNINSGSIPNNVNIETKVKDIKSIPIHTHHSLKDHHEKIIGVKRAMVKKMNESLNVPTFGYGDEYIMNEMINVRNELKSIGQEYGVKLSFMPFIIKACSLSLLEYPTLNAWVNNDCTELIHKGSHNIGVAVDSPDGLVVPVIKHCEQKSIIEIAKDLDILINKARNGNISNDDIIDGTFTLSNIGAIGGTYCRPVNFYPQVCIGALGTLKQFPRYNNNNELYKAYCMAISWSADHRVIDGATVARFSNKIKNYLEYPSNMILNLK